MIEDKMTNLMTRFPKAEKDELASLLVESDGHAGKVAAKLNADTNVPKSMDVQILNQDACEIHTALQDDGAVERAALAQKDPASALLALLQAMQEHAGSRCRHGCIFRAKRLWQPCHAEICWSPDTATARLQDGQNHSEPQGDCSVAFSLNQELKVLVKLVQEYNAGKENKRPCQQGCQDVASKAVDAAPLMQSGLRVRVVGAIGRGLEGTLRNYHDNHRRWSVVLDDGASYYLRGDDLEPSGSVQA